MEAPREAEDDRRLRRKELQSMWEFASVVAFLDSFEGDLKLHSFNLSGLEGALVELERVAEEHRALSAAAADQEEKSRSTTNGSDAPPPSSPLPSSSSSSSVAGADKVAKKEKEQAHHVNEVKEEVEVEVEAEMKQNGDHSEANGNEEEEEKEEEEEGEGVKEERKRKRQVKKEKEEGDDESEEVEEKGKEDDDGDVDDDDGDDRESDDDEGNARRRKKAKATEPWMENAGYQHLANLHIALLKNIIGRGASLLTVERWEGYLQRELDKHWDEAMEAYFGPANPLENSNYIALSLRTKARVLLLKVMCDLQLDANAALLAKIHEIASKGDHAQLRPSALGRDGRSRLYWYFSGGRHPYLYRETLPLLEDDRHTIIRPGKWKLVCSTLAEIEAFADDLIDHKNKQARRLATTIMHEVVPPLFARELEEEKAAKKKARSRKAGIDTRNVVNTRSRRARKAVDYTYNTKELDKAIREYNQQRDSDSDSDEDDDGDKQQDKPSSSKRTRARRASPTAAVQGTRSSTRIQQKRKRGAAE